jgi:SAM-dependent methyltransferase
VEREAADYDDVYERFNSPLMQRIRREAYGEDIGQHSWVTAEELRGDAARLGLSRTTHLLDLGCGPCGPLGFLVGLVGCPATGLDVSAPAIATGRTRIASLGLEKSISLQRANFDDPLPFSDGAFDAIIALDVIVHVRDRLAVFGEISRALAPGGRFLFTDAGVIAGVISSEEVQSRSIYGVTHFAPPGLNERMLTAAGLHLIETEDRTASALTVATGRRGARLNHRDEIEPAEGAQEFEKQQRYLETVIELSQRGAVLRLMYSCTNARPH